MKYKISLEYHVAAYDKKKDGTHDHSCERSEMVLGKACKEKCRISINSPYISFLHLITYHIFTTNKGRRFLKLKKVVC